MIKYDYKRLFISGDFYTLLDGEELKNDHPKFEVISSKTAFYSKLTYRDIPDYTNIRNRSDYDILRGKFGDNYQSWGEIVTEEISYEWSRRNNEILKATELFEQYKLLLSQGYRLYSKGNNLWMFELAYTDDNTLDILDLTFKVHQAETKLACELEDKTKATEKYQETARRLGTANLRLNENVNKLLVADNDLKAQTKLIDELRANISKLCDEKVKLSDDLQLATNRANHLEESIDSVTNDNLLLRNEVRILQIKLDKKKKWFS